jgi:hypothetical protein
MTGKEHKPTGSRKLPARAGRPRDLGAPEPKPSRKVALDEVLRTLQDLVGNELSVESPQKVRPEKTRRSSAADLPAETPNAVSALPEAATNLEIVTEAPEPESVTEIELTAPEPEQPSIVVPPEGLQQDLPHLEPEIIPATRPKPEPIPAVVAQDLEPIVTELPELEMAPAMETAPAPVLPASDHDHTPTDIPVLSDVVDEVEEIEAVALPADEAALPGLTMTPPVVDGRKLAIQVAARLNVELRKDGKPVLSSDVIARLAHALEEALAKAASNSENKDS